jgi:hypothetical protein
VHDDDGATQHLDCAIHTDPGLATRALGDLRIDARFDAGRVARRIAATALAHGRDLGHRLLPRRQHVRL